MFANREKKRSASPTRFQPNDPVQVHAVVLGSALSSAKLEKLPDKTVDSAHGRERKPVSGDVTFTDRLRSTSFR